MHTTPQRLAKFLSIILTIFLWTNSIGQVLIQNSEKEISDKEKFETYKVNYEKIQKWVEINSIDKKFKNIISTIPDFTEAQKNYLTERKISELRFYINREIGQRGWNNSKNMALFINSKNELTEYLANCSRTEIKSISEKADLELKNLSDEKHGHHKHVDIPQKGPLETNPIPEGPGQMCTNPGFGLCNFTNWELISGTVATASGPFSFLTPVNTTVFSTINFLGGGISTQHNITNGGTDPNTGQPMVFPGGGTCSALLGDGANYGAKASKLRQTFLVDATSNVLTMNYHVVLQDPSHAPAEQPYFQIRVLDQNGVAISCASYSAFANDGQAGWTAYPAGSTFPTGYYLPWTTVILPLTSYIGQNVTVEAVVGDCTLSGHSGYAYVDFDCQPITFNVTGSSPCNGPYTLQGPNGGLAYNWSNGATTQGISVTNLGYYSVNITPLTGGACTIFLDTTITGWPQFTTVANLTNPTICEGENTRAWIDSSITSYNHQWILPDGSTVNGHSYPINNATQADAGLYQVITIDAISNCIDTADVMLVINAAPTLSASDETICIGESVTISANGALNFTWNNGLGAGTSHSVSPLDTTMYIFTGTEANGCSAIDTLYVNVNPLPIIFAGNDTVICENGTIALNGQGAVSYVWDQGIFDGVNFTPTQTLTYTTTGTDGNGCVNTDDIIVNYEPLPIVNFDTDLLEGCQPLTVNLTNNTTGNLANCEWSFEDGTILNGCTTVEYNFPLAGTYDVTLATTSMNGCYSSVTYSDYIYVEAFPHAAFTIVQDENSFTTIENIADLVNTSIGAVSYQWNFNDGSANSTDFSPSHSFPTDRGGIYPVQLIAFSPLGCPDTTYQSIKVEGILLYFMPNTFTPDGDEFNNTFYPVITSGIDAFAYVFTIYNRYGEVIFETRDIHTGWDGTYKGELVKHGIYNWKMKYKTTENDEKFIETGHVNLVR